MYNKTHSQKGFSLVEAMVAAVIVGVGFVGIFSLSSTAMEAMYRSIAREKLLQQANQMLDVMGADVTNLSNYMGNFNTCTTPASGETDTVVLRKFEWCSRIVDSVGPRTGSEVRSIAQVDAASNRTLVTVRLEGYNGQIQVVVKRMFDK